MDKQLVPASQSPTWHDLTIWAWILAAGAFSIIIKLIVSLFNYSVKDHVEDAIKPLREEHQQLKNEIRETRESVKELSNISETLVKYLSDVKNHAHDIKGFENQEKSALFLVVDSLDKIKEALKKGDNSVNSLDFSDLRDAMNAIK